MRLSGTFWPLGDLGEPEERLQAHADARESVGSALLAVDHADGVADLDPGLAERLDRLDRSPAGGDDVLDEAGQLALLEGAFEPVPGAVRLRLLADDQEREARGEGSRGREWDGAELGAGKASCVRLDLLCGLCNRVAERPEQLGAGLEAVLVQIELRAPARAEAEIAFEVGDLPPGRNERLPLHYPRAVESSSRACASSRSAPAEPSASETIEPSPK